MRRSTKLMTATAITFLLVPSLAPRVLAADLVTGEGYVEPPQPDYIPSPAACQPWGLVRNAHTMCSDWQSPSVIIAIPIDFGLRDEQ